jgi:hypothetical protein
MSFLDNFKKKENFRKVPGVGESRAERALPDELSDNTIF